MKNCTCNHCFKFYKTSSLRICAKNRYRESTHIHTCEWKGIWKTIHGWHLSFPWIADDFLGSPWGFFWGSRRSCVTYFSGQIITTSHDLTPNGGLVREIPLFQGNLGWWNIIIWPDFWKYEVEFILARYCQCKLRNNTWRNQWKLILLRLLFMSHPWIHNGYFLYKFYFHQLFNVSEALCFQERVTPYPFFQTLQKYLPWWEKILSFWGQRPIFRAICYF